jgi:hypothetical protein
MPNRPTRLTYSGEMTAAVIRSTFAPRRSERINCVRSRARRSGPFDDDMWRREPLEDPYGSRLLPMFPE